jgi:hypothetical protein
VNSGYSATAHYYLAGQAPGTYGNRIQRPLVLTGGEQYPGQ